MGNDDRKLLVVVSLLAGKGPTGVETHFNLIMEYASRPGVETFLATRHSGSRLLQTVRGLSLRIARGFRQEYSIILAHQMSCWLLKRQFRWKYISERAKVAFETRFHADVLSAKWLDALFPRIDQRDSMLGQATKSMGQKR